MLTTSVEGGGGMMIGRQGRRSSRAVMGEVVMGLRPPDLKVLEQSDRRRWVVYRVVCWSIEDRRLMWKVVADSPK